eukprot:757094-Pyramimonas_sp.AAC.1
MAAYQTRALAHRQRVRQGQEQTERQGQSERGRAEEGSREQRSAASPLSQSEPARPQRGTRQA